MKKLALLILLFVLAGASAQAQNIVKSLERNVPGQGKVTIHQDPRIEAMIGMERLATGEQKVMKGSGFRIQAYAGNNTRQAKNDAYRVSSQVKVYFPELAVYTSFNPPRWLCRVGDFRSIEEADAMMRKMKATGVFKEVSIVKDEVNIPLEIYHVRKRRNCLSKSGGVEKSLSQYYYLVGRRRRTGRFVENSGTGG